MSGEGREVYDGFYYWHARVIEDTNWRSKPGWRAVGDQFFGSPSRYWLGTRLSYKRGPFRKTEAEAIADANQMLDALEVHKRQEDGRRV